MATTKLKGELVNLSGREIDVKSPAPIVNVVGKGLEDIQVGGQQGKVQVIVVVPSLDTPVCAAETRKFNEKAASLENTQVTVVSMDLPFAMDRFCTTEGIENLQVGSDFRAKMFAKSYGVLIADGPLAGITCRAIFVVNASGRVIYKEICEDITDEPDYDKAIASITDASDHSCCGNCQ